MTCRELDAKVLELVLGYRRTRARRSSSLRCKRLTALVHGNEPLADQVVWVRGPGEYYCKMCGNLPAYSTEIEAAWSLVDVFQQAGWYVSLIHSERPGALWEVNIARYHRIRDTIGRGDGVTVMVAICRAALAAGPPRGRASRSTAVSSRTRSTSGRRGS